MERNKTFMWKNTKRENRLKEPEIIEVSKLEDII